MLKNFLIINILIILVSSFDIIFYSNIRYETSLVDFNGTFYYNTTHNMFLIDIEDPMDIKILYDYNKQKIYQYILHKCHIQNIKNNATMIDLYNINETLCEIDENDYKCELDNKVFKYLWIDKNTKLPHKITLILDLIKLEFKTFSYDYNVSIFNQSFLTKCSKSFFIYPSLFVILLCLFVIMII